MVAERAFSNYYNLPGPAQGKLPMPGNDIGKLWQCAKARIAPVDTSVMAGSGRFGVFSYVMNLDLKLKSSVAGGVVNNSYAYPTMPMMSEIRHPSETVLITEASVSQSLEPGGSKDTIGVMPGARWTYFPKRHDGRGQIVFIDGHAAPFAQDYVVNPAGGKVEKMNPDIWWNPNRDR